jgi:hypothetical protein
MLLKGIFIAAGESALNNAKKKEYYEKKQVQSLTLKFPLQIKGC